MIKSCREIALEIDNLKIKLQQNKLVEMTLADISDKKKCTVNDSSIMCSNCNCWKIYDDKTAVEN